MASGAVWDPALADALGTRSAIYLNFESELPPQPVISADGVIYVIATADWGPTAERATITSAREADLYLGARQSDLRTAVLQALRQGVREVILHRVAAGAAALATITLDDEAAADALRVDAKYTGTFGNDLRVAVVPNVADEDAVDLIVYQGTRPLEKFTGATNTALVADYTAKGSDYVVLTVVGAADRAVATLASTALAGGVSGTGVVAGDYTTALAAATQASFTAFTIDSVDEAIQASASAWATAETAGGHRVKFVAGADPAHTFAEKDAQAVAFDDERTVYVVSGYTIPASLAGAPASSGDVTITSQWAAIPVAGIVAVQDYHAITNYTIADALDVAPKYGADDYTAGLEHGMLILSRSGTRVYVESGINTLQPSSQVAPKSRDWRKIRYTAVQDELVQRINAALDELYRGKVENDQRGRDEGKRIVNVVLRGMVADRLIQPGDEALGIPEPLAFFDPRYESDDDRVFLGVQGQFIDAIEKMFFTVAL